MDYFIMFSALVVGVIIGFFAAALVQMSKEGDRKVVNMDAEEIIHGRAQEGSGRNT
jgi:uncharacterized membrane-anchored protein YhcB (DUF1043 family)